MARRAGSTAGEVRAVLAGRHTDERLLRRLADVLGMHAADLFALAGLPVPDDLAPADTAAAEWVPYLVVHAVHLPAARRQEFLAHVRSPPRRDRRPGFAPREPAPHADVPGGRVVGLFRHRNLDRSGLARTLAVVTPTYLSPATYGLIGRGRAELTPRLVTDFAALLGMDAGELAVVTGVALPAPPPPPAPEAVDAAALL
ncbi:hypothetical protein [Streptomyces abyssomicinicus]|uniref:hypothetical protein n=1 Tax=Streptomyces abyssomicinicus TaxID=574929 RepID=UPI0012507819|nr:hypothetical protein [Streptomyces abyssomicinicus]